MYANFSAANTNSAAATAFRAIPNISTYKLAGQYPQFQFFAAPRFATKHKDWSSDLKLFYGLLNSRAGQKGYTENLTRQQIADELGFNLRRLDRALAEGKQHGLFLSLKRGNGEPNAFVLLQHPDMDLPEKELRSRRIDLPKKIRLLVERTQKRNPSVLPQMAKLTPSVLPNTATPKEIKDRYKEIEKEEAQARPQAVLATPSNRSADTESNTQVKSYDSPIIAKIEKSTAQTPTPAPVEQKKAKIRKPKSKHSLELCLRFSQAEKARKGSIENAQDFGEACYWTGKHDKEIDRWLRRRARIEVGKYRPSTSAPTTTEAQAPAEPPVANPDRIEMERMLELDKERELALARLSPDELEQRIKVKLEELMASEHRDKFKRMSKDSLREHTIEAVKRDLVT